MKKLNNKSQNFQRKMKGYYCSALLLTLMGASSPSQAMIADGDYRIYCNTKHGTRKFLEAFPLKDEVKLETQKVKSKDQKWKIEAIGNNNYKISCKTRNSGEKVLEAFPRRGTVRPRKEKGGNADQVWTITPHNGSYRISCLTHNSGDKFLEAFPLLGKVKPEKYSRSNVDQLWQIKPWKGPKLAPATKARKRSTSTTYISI